KALVKLLKSTGEYIVAASQNRDKLKLLQLRDTVQTIRLKPDDIYAIIKYKNNSIQKEEFYYGDSFLSQSSRFMVINKKVSSISITNNKGVTRSITFD